MSNPNEILERLGEDEKAMTAEINRLHQLKELMQKNGYSGKYRGQFEGLYEDILEAKEVILHCFEDGFQFSDLEEIFVAGAPVLKEVYDQCVPLLQDEKEAEKFLRDLVIFVYYEVEPYIQSWGFVKFVLRIALRLWVAGKIARYMKVGFDWADGKVLTAKTAVLDKAQPFINAFSFEG